MTDAISNQLRRNGATVERDRQTDRQKDRQTDRHSKKQRILQNKKKKLWAYYLSLMCTI